MAGRVRLVRIGVVEVLLGPTRDAVQESQRLRVAAIEMGINEPARRLLVDVVRRIGWLGGVEVTIRLEAQAPFMDEGVELLAAGLVAGGRVHPRQPREHLAKHVKRARRVPAAEVGARGGLPGALAEPLQVIVVGHAQVAVAHLQHLAQQRPVIEDHAAIIEWLD